MIHLLILLLTIPFGEALASAHRINFFPETETFYWLLFDSKAQIIKPRSGSSNEIISREYSLMNLFGHTINDQSYLTVSIPYLTNQEDNRKINGTKMESITSSGFREPNFTYAKRFKRLFSEGDTIQDLSLSFTPSVTERKIGTKNSNSAIGGNYFEVNGSLGTHYTNWEAKFFTQLTYQMEQVEENLENGDSFTFTPTTTYSLGIEFQLIVTERLSLRGSSGLKFNQTYDVKDQNTKAVTTVQQGTGSITYLGMVYRINDELYFFNLTREKNDFFAESNTADNFKGHARIIGISLSYLRLF